MSKNIIIQEGGVAKQMTASKLKTNLVGSGTCLWVPEDETTLKTKNISKNGTYAATSDNAYGYSQVTVNVAGGDGSATSSGKPTTSNGVDPGGSGSSVIGKDTSGVISGTPGGDGNEYAIGIDSSGNIVATKVPSGIEIGKAPDKTSYTEGETIDYSGIIVILKGGDSAMFSNQDYPNGRIPYNELIFPISVAPSGGGGSGGKTSDLETNLVQPLNITPAGTFLFHGINGWTPRTYFDYPSLVFWEGNTPSEDAANYRAIVFSDSPGECYLKYESGGRGGGGSLQPYTYDNKTVYYRGFGSGGSGGIIDYTPNNVVDLSHQSNAAQSAWTAVYGESSGGTAEIPVQWKSPYDGRTFEDTFEITVTSSGGGYSDDSSGSESGGGGHF